MIGTFDWNIKILRHAFFTGGLLKTMDPAFFIYPKYWLSWISIPPLGLGSPTALILRSIIFVQVPFLWFSFLKCMQNALSFKEIHTLYGLSILVIKLKHKNSMKVTFAVNHVSSNSERYNLDPNPIYTLCTVPFCLIRLTTKLFTFIW